MRVDHGTPPVASFIAVERQGASGLPVTSHLAMLYAIAGEALIREAYSEALRAGYLWHEFGDSHLILPRA